MTYVETSLFYRSCYLCATIVRRLTRVGIYHFAVIHAVPASSALSAIPYTRHHLLAVFLSMAASISLQSSTSNGTCALYLNYEPQYIYFTFHRTGHGTRNIPATILPTFLYHSTYFNQQTQLLVLGAVCNINSRRISYNNIIGRYLLSREGNVPGPFLFHGDESNTGGGKRVVRVVARALSPDATLASAKRFRPVWIVGLGA